MNTTANFLYQPMAEERTNLRLSFLNTNFRLLHGNFLLHLYKTNRYIDGFIELIRYSTSNKIGNIRFIDGEPCKFITFKQYADILLKDTLKQPEIIASTEI